MNKAIDSPCSIVWIDEVALKIRNAYQLHKVVQKGKNKEIVLHASTTKDRGVLLTPGYVFMTSSVALRGLSMLHRHLTHVTADESYPHHVHGDADKTGGSHER